MIKRLLQIFKRDDQPINKRRSLDRGILHISDLHVVCDETEQKWLAYAEKIARAYAPEKWIIVVSGDLVDHGKAEEYARLMDGFALLRGCGFQIYIVPGNHDYGPWGNIYRSSAHRNFLEFADTFSEVSSFPKRVDFDGWRLLLLDSTAHDEQGEPFARGRIGTEQLAWLETHLASPGACFIVMHHRPYWGNRFLAVSDREDLHALVERRTDSGRIVKYLCGHRHEEDLSIIAAGKFLDEVAVVEVDPLTGFAQATAL